MRFEAIVDGRSCGATGFPPFRIPLGDITDALTPEDEEDTEETVTGSGVVLMSPFLNLLLKVLEINASDPSDIVTVI